MHNDIKTITLSTAGTNVEIAMGQVLSRVREGILQFIIIFS